MNLDINNPQTPVFITKVSTIEKYKDFVKSNNLRLPTKFKDKRTHFIKWFLDENSSNTLNDNISNLSQHFLYISSRTIEDILFKNETTS